MITFAVVLLIAIAAAFAVIAGPDAGGAFLLLMGLVVGVIIANPSPNPAHKDDDDE